jgi:hypothetical protein
VPGIVEALHARFTDHAYPEHTHDAWTLLLVDEGAVRYDLDRHEHGALRPAVTLLPRRTSRTPAARPPRRVSASACSTSTPPCWTNGSPRRDRPPEPARRPAAGSGSAQLHASLGEPLAAESRPRAGGRAPARPPGRRRARAAARPARRRPARPARRPPGRGPHPARRRGRAALPPRAPRAALHRGFRPTPAPLPHGRRIEAARGRLLAGEPISDVAVAVGFHDQAHLHRHFAKLVGTTPARFARQGARWRDDLPR